MEETKLFLITYFAALLGVIPPGLVNMTIAKTCVQDGKENGIYAALGASIVVLLQALLAILLAKYIFDNPLVQNVLLRAGLVIFLILGVYFLIMAKKEKSIEEHPDKSNTSSVFKGMLVAVLNIFPIPYFVAIAAALNVNGGVNYDISIILAFIFAAAMGTFTTLYFYIVSFAKIENRFSSFTKYSNYFMAVLMLVLVVITLLRIFVNGE